MRAVALLALLASPAAAQLFADTNVLLPSLARDVAGGDLDGDGDRDLVSCSNATGSVPVNSVQVWLGDGSGQLSAGVTLNAMAGVERVLLLDANLDGRLDVLAVSPGNAPLYTGGFTVFLGDGAGSFPASVAQFVGGGPSGPALADVNGDGLLDLALALPYKAQVTLLHGTGTGAFATPATLVAGIDPRAVALPDLALDGWPDVAVLNVAGATVTVRPGFGGSFGAPVSYATGAGATDLLAATLDADAFPDLLVANGDDATLSLLRGDGAGGLLPQQVLATLPVPHALLAADVDLDADLDVLAANGTLGFQTGITHAVSLLVATGAGSFAAPQGVMTGTGALGLDVGDLDGDLLPDLAAARSISALELRSGDGLGGFVDIPFHATAAGPGGLALAPLDGDATLDLALANVGPDLVSRLAGDGAGGLGAPVTFAIGVDASPNDLAAADVSGDGRLDLVTSDIKTDDVALFVADGAGGYLAPQRVHCGDEPRALVAADLDGDGKADVVSCNTSGNSVGVLRSSGGGLLPVVPTAVGAHPTCIARGHVDAGGSWDVVTANEFAGSYTLLRGDGAAGWQPTVSVPDDGFMVPDVTLADVNGDGLDDLLSVFNQPTSGHGTLAVRLANGAGGFAAPLLVSIARLPEAVIAADLDLDGTLDAATAHDGPAFGAGREVAVLHGLGGGGFGPPQAHLLDQPCTGLAAGDLDADGAPDLVVALQTQASVAVLRNLSLGGAWSVLGSALAGDFAPKLAGAGSLAAGSPGKLTLFDAPPLALAVLFFAPTSTPVPFKGGTLVPVPPTVSFVLGVPPSGGLALAWTAFPPLASGSTFFFQAAVVDSGAPAGVALSDAVKAVVP